MIPAKEANKLTAESILSKTEDELKCVEYLVIQCAKLGYNYIFYTQDLSKDAIVVLQSTGYTVESFDPGHYTYGALYKISW